MVDGIEMSGVFSAAAKHVLILDATDVFSADTADVLSAAKAADGGFCPATGDDYNNDLLWEAMFGNFGRLLRGFWQAATTDVNLYI